MTERWEFTVDHAGRQYLAALYALGAFWTMGATWGGITPEDVVRRIA